MRWSRQLIPTLREVPQEAEIASHQLLLRAGFIRRLAGGLYTFLPLGLRALRKAEQIVREEMDRAGALEILMPALHPREIWEQTGRFAVLREVMFAMQDRQGRHLVLGPTHEEIVTDLVAHTVRSYRQLPLNLYQIQTKYRDEIRPRFGLMRAKEFIMKDAYSFDADPQGASACYKAMYRAYERIFHRCGLRTRVVEADSGAMGGSSSHEFMVLAEAGEDGIVECSACSYAANLERAEGRRPAEPRVFPEADQPARAVETPGRRTVAEVCAFLDAPPERLVKTLLYRAGEQLVAVLVPGDRDVNEIKLQRRLGTTALALADDETILRCTGAPVGFAGPVGLDLPIVADASLRGGRGLITGANQADRHFLHVDMERDVPHAQYADLVLAREGDGCPRCAEGVLRAQRGIEVGHVFQLGTKYSEQLGAIYLDAEGRQHPTIMGCYGIGVTRTLQAVVEQCRDENGILWPISLAPYDVEVLAVNVQHAESAQVAGALADGLEQAGLDVLYDDRDERPGVKFKDADLVGLPLRVSVGERSLARGGVELKWRATGAMEIVPVEQAVEAVLAAVRDLRAALAPAETLEGAAGEG